MDINWGSITWLSSGFTVASSCEQRGQNLFPQHDEARHSSKPLLGGFIVVRTLDPLDQVFATKFLQIIRSLASMIIGEGIAKDLFHPSGKVRRCESSWIDRETHDPLHHGPHSSLIDINTSDSDLPHLRGKRPPVQPPVVNEGNVYTPQNLQESFQDALEQGNDLRKLIDPLPTVQLLGIVNDHLDSQDVFAFAIHLDRQLPEMDFEDRQIIDRFLDHGLASKRGSPFLPLKEWTMLGAKDGLDHLEVQGSSRSINDTMKHLIQVPPSREEKVAAIFALVDRIGVNESTFLLLPTLQSKAQTAVNPTLTGPNQAPYRARGSHGICDSGQTCGVGDFCKTVTLFGEGNLFFLGLMGHVFMTIENHLSIKGRMRAEFDGQMSPLRVHDMKRIMIDIRGLGLDVGDSLLGAVDLENGHWCHSSDDTEDTSETGVFGDMLFGQFMLLFSPLAVNQWNALLLGISMDSPAEATRKSHQVCVVKRIIRPHQLTPPSPKASWRLGQIKIAIEHDTIYTIICAIEILLIIATKLVWHLHLSFPPRRFRVKTIRYEH